MESIRMFLKFDMSRITILIMKKKNNDIFKVVIGSTMLWTFMRSGLSVIPLVICFLSLLFVNSQCMNEDLHYYQG